MIRRPCRRGLAALGADRRGLALIEFAFALPILVLLFVGGYQLMDAISCYRKVTTTVRTLADLTTQSTSMTASSANQILAASQQIMEPYATSAAVMRISQVKIDPVGVATVDWSVSLNGVAYSSGTALNLPAQLLQPNTYLIYSEVSYQYAPTFASNFIGPIALRDTIYMAPRNSGSIPMGS